MTKLDSLLTKRRRLSGSGARGRELQRVPAAGIGIPPRLPAGSCRLEPRNPYGPPRGGASWSTPTANGRLHGVVRLTTVPSCRPCATVGHIPMNFSLGCSLVYRVKSPTPFVFNFEAARFDAQTVQKERLQMIPKTSIERWTMPEKRQPLPARPRRTGRIPLRYEAEVELSPRLEDPDAVTEISRRTAPFRGAYAPLSKPTASPKSRAGFAGRTFGDLPPGYHRVNGVCNWICDNVDYALGLVAVVKIGL